VVITTSGGRLVGEIKRIEKDVLTFSTDYSDSDFKIEWEKIASIESDRQFLVETFEGKRLAGSLKPDPEKKATAQIAGTKVQLPEVSAAQPFERSIWSRFDSALDFGYSMTQANAPKTARWDLGNDLRRLLGSQWYVNTTQDFLNRYEQGLDLRTTIGVGGGRYVLRSSSQCLALGGGLALNHKRCTDPLVPTNDSAQAYLGTEFMTERMKLADLLTRLTYYPSLTISGPYRVDYNFNLDFNLKGDWCFRIGLFENYDSKPPSGLSKFDYGWSNGFLFEY
jgi:hypothetical protein